MQIAEDPTLLQGDGVFDGESGKNIPTRALVDNWRKYHVMIQLISRIRSGFIQLSLRDYLALPATLVDAFGVYDRYREESAKKKKPGS